MSNWTLARSALSDHHGVWCAWCLGYIGRNELEDHHVLGFKKQISRKFGIEPWTVPVHENNCHRKGLQTPAYTMGRRVLNIVEEDPTKFGKLCEELFYQGCLPVCLLLRQYALNVDIEKKNLVGVGDNLKYALIAAAGCALGIQFVNRIESEARFLEIVKNVDTRLYISSVRANAGDITSAKKAYEELAALVPRVQGTRSESYAKLVRMTAIVEPTRSMATEGMSIAQDSRDPTYHRRTSRLALASAFESERKYTQAQEEAHELAEDFMGGQPSWWHYLEWLFLLGRTQLLSSGNKPSRDSVRAALKTLIRAQYASAFLNFAGVPIPDFRSRRGWPELTKLTPTEVIHWIGQKHGEFLPRQVMTEIRHEAIFGRLVSTDPNRTSPFGFQSKVLALFGE